MRCRYHTLHHPVLLHRCGHPSTATGSISALPSSLSVAPGVCACSQQGTRANSTAGHLRGVAGAPKKLPLQAWPAQPPGSNSHTPQAESEAADLTLHFAHCLHTLCRQPRMLSRSFLSASPTRILLVSVSASPILAPLFPRFANALFVHLSNDSVPASSSQPRVGTVRMLTLS